jgi:hypothetical protein
MKTAALLIVLTARASLLAEDLPATMIMLTVKLESPEIPKDSFAAQPKRMYRAGSGFCRTDENPDLARGIHGLLIINEPNIWMINRLDRTAKHIVDPGPTFNCRMPMFVTTEDVKSAQDLKKPEMNLEFGRELEYFRSRSDPPVPGPTLLGKATMVYMVEVGGSQLFLFTAGKPEVPVSVVRTIDKKREIFWYGEYSQQPFDIKLFARPEGVKIEEVHQ